LTLSKRKLRGMAETPETDKEDSDRYDSDASMTASGVENWFIREVLPLEAILMHYLHQNWRNKNDIEDLRQEIYARVCESAQAQIPDKTKSFLFATARNLLIDRIRRSQVVPIEAVTDLDALEVAIDTPGPERSVIARDVLRRLQTALDQLPPNSREVILLRRIEGLSRSEIAARLGITERMVSEHLTHGMAILTRLYLRDPAELGRKP
jgi:RNA polymerase sigma factor (sigma-70 family)